MNFCTKYKARKQIPCITLGQGHIGCIWKEKNYSWIYFLFFYYDRFETESLRDIDYRKFGIKRRDFVLSQGSLGLF